MLVVSLYCTIKKIKKKSIKKIFFLSKKTKFENTIPINKET